MDKVLKQRLIGASILIALAVIFLPMFFDAPQDERGGREMSIDLPEPPTDRAQVRRMPLDPDQARRPPPESLAEPTSPVPEAAESMPVQDTEVAEIEAPLEPQEEEAPGQAASEEIAEVRPAPEAIAEQASDPSPEPAPAPAASEAESSAEVADAEGWLVQVASFGAESTAAEIVERLTSLGHRAGAETLVRGDMTLHRVVTGPYPSREDAERARGQIERTVVGVNPEVRTGPAPASRSQPALDEYAVQLGSFASRNNADRLVAQLAGMDFDAFIHEDSSGSRTIWRVRMGPYGSRAEADRRLAEVGEKAGLEGLVVSHP